MAGEHDPEHKKPAGSRRTPPAEGGEILHSRRVFGRKPYPVDRLSARGRGKALRSVGPLDLPVEAPASLPRPSDLCRLRKSGSDVLRDTGDTRLQTLRATDEVALAELAAGAADRGVEGALVALGQAGDLVAALTQLALDLGAGTLELALELVARGGAATLVLAHVHVRLALDLLDLALSGGALGVRLDRLDDVVTRGQRGADAGEHDALDLLRGGLDGGHLSAAGLLGGASGLRRGRLGVTPGAAGGVARLASARLSGVALTGGSGAAGRGAARGAGARAAGAGRATRAGRAAASRTSAVRAVAG